SIIRPGATPARDEPKAQDLVIFANGDRLEGIVSAVTPEELTLMVGTATQSVALSSVVEIKLATIGDAPKPKTPAKFEVRLTDGSVMSTPGASITDGALAIDVDGQKREIPLGRVQTVEQVGGPVQWLSAITPTT